MLTPTTAIRSDARFPRIIRLHDRLDACEESNRRTLTLLWCGSGFASLLPLSPYLGIKAVKATVASGGTDDGGWGGRSLRAALGGLFLLATWFSTRVYRHVKAVKPRKEAGLGLDFNPIKFDRMIGKLREIGSLRDRPSWNPERKSLMKKVADWQAWLAGERGFLFPCRLDGVSGPSGPRAAASRPRFLSGSPSATLETEDMNGRKKAKELLLLLVILGLWGLVIWFDRQGYDLGSLPGDVFLAVQEYNVYFPVTTTVIVSALFNLVAYLLYSLVHHRLQEIRAREIALLTRPRTR